MTETERNELRREAFTAGALWAQRRLCDTPTLNVGDELDRRYPVIDVQQGPSRRWYRVVKRDRGGNGFIGYEVHSWASQEQAFDGRDGYRVIEPEDVAAVADLLRRHAARATGENS